MTSQRCPQPHPQILKYFTLGGKKDLAGVVKVKEIKVER